LNAFIKLTRATESLLGRLSQRDTAGGLTPTQFGVLETLFHLGTLCQGDLSRKLLRSTGNLTLVIDNLEKRGLVRRVRDTQDRRMVMILLTEAGEALIRQVLPGQMASIVAEMSVLSPEEQEALGRLCYKLGTQEDA
jgi:MarR family 2-MHQ and catechol resistance regulon transcriptional repressor